MNVYIPLSSDNLKALVPQATVLRYSALKRLTMPMILLYETEPNYGHWVCILETPQGIEHFDSYGIVPDGELKWVPEWLKSSTGQDVKKLLSLLYHSNQKINYNTHKLQSSDSATCGRWCVLRIMFSSLGTDQFAHMVKVVSESLGMTPDEMVSIAVS